MAHTTVGVDAPDRVNLGPARSRRPYTPRRRRHFGPYLLILPTLVIIAALLLWPMINMVRMSFHKVAPKNVRPVDPEPWEWVGTRYFTETFNDPFFWDVLRNTVAFAAVTVFLTMVLGTLVGLLLNRLGRKMATFVSVGALLAWATPAISAAIVFRWLFEATGGAVNWVLEALPDWLVGSGWKDYSWFSTPLPMFTVLVLCVVWQSFPFIAVCVLAGLKSVPTDLFEAARVDGASPWQIFWKVTFPLLKPIFGILTTLSLIWDFRVLTQLIVMTGGVANRDMFTLPLYAWAEAFATTPKYGLASALALILTAILLVVTGFYLRSMVRQGQAA